jgi:hypothetical protein
MKNQNTIKSAWTTPELAIYGKVKDITQDWWKQPGVGDGVIICIDDNPTPVSTCPPDSC